jgi:glycosyltransferase involved in cell wall biosynthesis
MGGTRVVCLLSARNAAADLPGWFESAARFADAVVALDDGSTDDTGARLAAHPLTARLLTNPRRETYHGWDDGANRNQLLAAAADLRPDWIVTLDADERIDADDAAALRDAVESGLDPGDAYLFRVYRMIGDDGHWDRNALWVGRMFAWRPGQRFADATMHVVAVPIDVPRDRWRQTTIRIQHLASTTDVKRHQRFAKYGEADPDRRWVESYDHLLDGPGAVRPWEARPPGLPFVRHGRARPVAPPAAGAPVGSAVVISQNDADRIRGCLDALAAQRCEHASEVVVVTSGTDATADIVRSEYPAVRLVELDHPAGPGEARNAGLAVARGEFVLFPGSHVRVRPGYLAATLDAHRAGWAMVTGAFENGTDTTAGWANFFLDHSSKLPARPAAPTATFPATASYRRDALVAAGGFPEVRVGEDTSVNARLWELGYGAWFTPGKRIVHDTPCVTAAALLRHHAKRGRGFGRRLQEELAAGRLLTRAGLRSHLVLYVPGRLWRARQNVTRYGTAQDRRQFRRSFPLMAAGAAVHWSVGWTVALPTVLRALPIELRARRRALDSVTDS